MNDKTPAEASFIRALVRRSRLLTPRERRQWALLSVAGIVKASLETFLGAAVYGVLLVLVNPNRTGSWLDPMFTAIPALRTPSGLLWALFALALLQGGKRLFFLAVELLHGHWVTGASNELAARLFGAYLAAPWSLHMRRSPTDLTQNVLTHVVGLYRVFGAALSLVADVLTLAGLVVVAGVAAPRASLLVAGAATVGLGAFLRLNRARAEKASVRLYELSLRLARRVHEGLSTVKELRVLGRERHFRDGLAMDQAEMARIKLASEATRALPALGTDLIFGLGVIGTVAVAVGTNGDVTPLVPLLGLFGYLGLKAIPIAHAISLSLWEIRWQVAHTAAIATDLETLAMAENEEPREPRLRFSDALELDRVSFTYAEAAHPVLRDVSLRIRRGEAVAIVGPTGAGKTTLIDLLLGLHEPTEGEIRIDGVPLAAVVRRWQDRIGYVPQAPCLVDDTLRRNVALGVPDAAIDEAAVRRSLRTAQLAAFVDELPGGLDTPVGERGVRLSGGERQRVAIARALYADPDVLVFDEATASLDPATERDLTAALEALREGKTLIVVAHRLSTVERCDRIVLLKGGRVEAVGTYAELLAQSEAFRRHAGLAPAAAARSALRA